MGSSTSELAPGSNSRNVVQVGGGGGGSDSVQVSGCSTSGLTEPVIEVTTNKDPSDALTGANNTTHTASAWVYHWSANGQNLIFDVDTTDPTTGAAVNSDYAFTVTC
jgi:hypothetical protein